MRTEGIKLLAGMLANDGKVVDYTQNSVFNMLEIPNISPIESSDQGVTSNGETSQNYKAMVERIAAVVSNEVSTYKNKFIPFLKEYKEAVATIAGSKKPMIDMTRYGIVEVSIPAIIREYMNDGQFVIESDNFDLPISILSLPNPGNAEAIRRYAMSASPSLNVLITELLDNYSDQELIDFWDKYLLNISGSNDNIDSLSYRYNKKLDDLALLYLIVRNLKTITPEDLNVDISLYNKIMDLFSVRITYLITLAVTNYKNFVKINRLIVDIADNSIIYVNSDVYSKYCEQDNCTVEGLLGILFAKDINSNNYLLLDIIENVGSYEIMFNNKIKLETIATKTAEVNIYRAAYSIALADLYKHLMPEVEEVLRYDLNTSTKIVEKFTSSLEFSILEDIDTLATSIVTDVLIDNDNFKRFVKYIENYSAVKDITPNEAASFATLELIVDYLLSQVRVAR